MKRLAYLIAGIIVLYSPRSLAAEPPLWGDLSSWVGKYPTNKEAGHIKRLWEEPAVRKSLGMLLSRADLKRLDSIFVVEKQIAKIDRFIVVEQCMPHNCPDAHAMVVFDTEARRLWAGFYERTQD